MADVDVHEAGGEIEVAFAFVVVEVDSFRALNGDRADAFLLAPGEEGVIEVILYDLLVSDIVLGAGI